MHGLERFFLDHCWSHESVSSWFECEILDSHCLTLIFQLSSLCEYICAAVVMTSRPSMFLSTAISRGKSMREQVTKAIFPFFFDDTTPFFKLYWPALIVRLWRDHLS